MFARTIASRKFQRIFQVLSLIIINGHYNFFNTFSIYQGKLKAVCIPVLNCYSCPLALYSCPLGALQFFIMTKKLPFYVLSLIALIGITLGRMSCGLMCPFGFLQDLLFRIGSIRIEIPKCLTYLKYVMLVGVVLGIPYLFSLPAFCQICPTAVLEAGFPLMLMYENVAERLFDQENAGFIGWLFLFKSVFLLAILVFSVNIKRPFCRVLCPLGALLSVFNRFSTIRLEVDNNTCNKCQFCARICPVDINISDNPDSSECIRCMRCTYCKSVTVEAGLVKLHHQKSNG